MTPQEQRDSQAQRTCRRCGLLITPRGNTVSKGDGTNDCADNEHDFGDSQAGDEPTLDELLDLLQNGKSPLLDFNKQRIRDYAERLAAEARIDELRKFNSDVLEVEKVGGGWLSDEIAEFAKQILEFNDARIATLTKEKQ